MSFSKKSLVFKISTAKVFLSFEIPLGIVIPAKAAIDPNPEGIACDVS